MAVGDRPGTDPGVPSAAAPFPGGGPDGATSGVDYRFIFAHNPMPMWIYDAASLRFLDVNEAAIRHYGYTRTEFLAMTIEDIRPREDVPRLREAIRELPLGFQRTGRWRHRVKSGALIDIEGFAGRLEADGQSRIIVVINDVTDRVRAEASLREMEARFLAIAANAPLSLSIKDTQGRYQFCNAEAQRALGPNGGAYLGKTARDFVGESAAHAEAEDRRVVETGETSVTEVDLPPGSAYERMLLVKFPIRDSAGVVVGIGSFGIDMTREKHAQAALKSAEQHYERIVKLVQEAIWIHDQGIIIFANPAAARLYGAPDAAALIGRSVFDFLDAEDRERALRRTAKMVADQQPLPPAEMRIVGLDGRKRVAELQAVPFRQGDKQLVVASGRDVTDQRDAEARLLQVQKMEAVGQLTGGVAHDFNNLLTIIMGALDHDPARFPPDLAPGITQALQAAERGAALTHRLLAFSRRQTLIAGAVDFNRLVAGMEDLLRRTLGEQIEIAMTLSSELWPALADASQVENALLNLAINARDAMNGGGTLTIETANIHLDEDYAAANPGLAPGDYAMLAVSDTGIGMTPEVLKHAFEPFFTTKEVGKGTGLGLAMIYGFARQSRGHVSIYSEVGQGTIVKLYLPRLVSEAPRTEASPTAPAATGGRETILVVEDDANVRKLVLRQLTGLGYQVIEAANGKQALEIIDAGTAIDLLFTDVVMPGGMNGRQLADAARQRRPGLRTLFTSGYTTDSILRQGKLEPKTRMLSKPYRKNDLAQKVREALDEA